MTHNETGTAAQVLNHELTATRNFFDKLGEVLASLAGLSGLVSPTSKQMRNKQDVYEDLYYPHEAKLRA